MSGEKKKQVRTSALISTVKLHNFQVAPNTENNSLNSGDGLEVEDFEEMEAAHKFNQRAISVASKQNLGHIMSSQTFVQNHINMISTNILRKKEQRLGKTKEYDDNKIREEKKKLTELGENIERQVKILKYVTDNKGQYTEMVYR
jgi:hypothetical protein